jgi:hypothetical protein
MRDFIKSTEYDAHMHAKFEDLFFLDFCKEILQVWISWNYPWSNNTQI